MHCGGSIFERMRRHARITLDEQVAHSALIYDDDARPLLAAIHGEYIDAVTAAGMPMLILASTWRASRDRIARSRFADRPINADNVAFIREVAADRGAGEVYVAGVLGPRGDAYRPEEALAVDAAADYHRLQADQLAAAGADVLMTMTCPALSEARGMARAMAATGVPYLVSFVLRDTGTLLDGTRLVDAIAAIDDDGGAAPLGYFANCIHPTVLEAAVAANPPSVVDRLVGLKANTSALRPEELDGAAELIVQPAAEFADQVVRAQRALGLGGVGGCCGTGTEHVVAIAERLGRV